MRHSFFFALCIFWGGFFALQAQEKNVIQIFGIVSEKGKERKPLETVTISVKGQFRGTFTNKEGVFSLAARAGDTLEFSYVGYKSIEYPIPPVDKKYPFHFIQESMEESLIDLPDFQVRGLPTRAQFERDFVNMSFEEDLQSIAIKNLNARSVQNLIFTIPIDGAEAASLRMQEQERNFIYYKQLPAISIFNPFAWAQFIQQLKSGSVKIK